MGITAIAGMLLLIAMYLGWPRSGARVDVRADITHAARISSTLPAIRFHWHLEGAPQMNLRQTGEDEYSIWFAGTVNFFLFKVEGAAGRTLRFHFNGVSAKDWSAIRPVCGSGDDLSDPTLFELGKDGRSNWRYMEQMEIVGEREISYTYRFENDAAYVALRVPYTLGYQQRSLANLTNQRGIEVITIGRSAEKRPLTLIKIGSGEPRADWQNPCVLLYAREHCDEPDSSWVVQGAWRFLTSDESEARRLRNRFTFLLIPMLDPDGAASAMHTHSGSGFGESAPNADAETYAKWFQQLIDDGKRLDLVLNFHNPEPHRYEHVFCPQIEGGPSKEHLARALLANVVAELKGRFGTVPKPSSVGATSGRLGSYLSACYGSLHVPFEINSQNPERRLTHLELMDLGRSFVIASTRFLSSPESKDLAAETTRTRATRQAHLAQKGVKAANERVLLMELRAHREIDAEKMDQPAVHQTREELDTPTTLPLGGQ